MGALLSLPLMAVPSVGTVRFLRHNYTPGASHTDTQITAPHLCRFLLRRGDMQVRPNFRFDRAV